MPSGRDFTAQSSSQYDSTPRFHKEEEGMVTLHTDGHLVRRTGRWCLPALLRLPLSANSRTSERACGCSNKIQGPLITTFSRTLYHLWKVKLTTIHTIPSAQNILHTLLHTRKKMFSRMSQLYLLLSTPLTVDKKPSTQMCPIHPLRWRFTIQG